MASVQQWKVVGGSRNGGILVREGPGLQSRQLSERLSTGAVVRKLQLEDGRLRYELLNGSGPQTGWVSLKANEVDLLVPTGSATGQARSGQRAQTSTGQANAGRASQRQDSRASRPAASTGHARTSQASTGNARTRQTQQPRGAENGGDLLGTVLHGVTPMLTHGITQASTGNARTSQTQQSRGAENGGDLLGAVLHGVAHGISHGRNNGAMAGITHGLGQGLGHALRL